MGNTVDTIEKEDPMTDTDSEPGAVDIIIDLDAPEYHQYLKDKRKSLSEGALLNDISYLEWRRNNNGIAAQTNLVLNQKSRPPEESKHRNGHEKVVKRLSTPITGNEILAVKQHSKEFEKRALGSKQRIENTKKKYNLKDRDYSTRTYQWNEEDEKQVKKEREQRKLLRQQIRIKYNLPAPKFHRTAAVVSG